MNAEAVPDYVANDTLHPIARKAGARFIGAQGTMPADALTQIERELHQLADDPQLGPALVSLVKLAAHLDQDLKAERAAQQIMSLAMTMTPHLEAQTERARRGREDSERAKRKRIARMLGS